MLTCAVHFLCTQAALREHFGQFGDLVDVALMRNKHTGQPRGFGFVKFKDAACEYTGRLGSHATQDKVTPPPPASCSRQTVLHS